MCVWVCKNRTLTSFCFLSISHMAMSNAKAQKKIVMFPFMAYGHLNPFLALARNLERRKGYAITIVNTPLNINKLKSSLPCNTNITLVEIPFNATDYIQDKAFPPDVENTDTLPFLFIAPFMIASQNLRSPFKKLVIDIIKNDGCAPVCIIADMFLGWTVEVANELGIFHSVFIAGAGYSMAIYFSICLYNNQYYKAEEEDEDDEELLLLLDFPEASTIQKTQLGFDLKLANSVTSPLWDFRERQFLFCLNSDAILLNGIDGNLGDIGAKYFSRKTGGKPVWMIGPACSTPVRKEGHKTLIYNVSQFLDLQPPASVLYVSFGSMGALLPSLMRELALGLEASGRAFIWVTRPPFGVTTTTDEEDEQVVQKAEWFPDGFEERMRRNNQGLLVPNWAPQLEILSHKSTGAFLSHCGWNSVLESLCEGVPIIGWPLVAEQFFNSKMLEEEAGVCVEIARGMETENVKQDRIAQVIKMVMGKTEKGEDMRRKVGEIKGKLEEATRESEGFKGSSIKAMDEFLNAASIKK